MKYIIPFLIVIALVATYLQDKTKQIKQDNEARKMLSEVKSTYNSLIKDPKNINKLHKVKTTGEVGKAEGFLKKGMLDISTVMENYLLELDAIEASKVLDIKQIKKDKKLTKSKYTVQLMKNIIRKYRLKSLAALDNMVSVDNTKSVLQMFDASTKKSIKENMNENLKIAKKQLNRMWYLEAEIATTYELIINLLADHRHSWLVKDNKLVFQNQKKLNRFNKLSGKILSLENLKIKDAQKSIKGTNKVYDELLK